MLGRRVATGLWAIPGFSRFWSAYALSEVGSQASKVAWPLLAAGMLGATPGQMGLLVALMSLPHVVVTLFAGVWVDRRPRRPILIWCDLLHGLLLAGVPLAAWLGWLRIEQMYVVGFLLGALTVVFTVAYQSYLPSLVRREQLVDANGQMLMTSSVARVGGPAPVGLLVAALGAPLLLLVDALSFLASAVLVRSIRSAPAPPAPVAKRT